MLPIFSVHVIIFVANLVFFKIFMPFMVENMPFF